MSATDSETYIACKMQNTQALQYCQAYSLGKKAAKSQPIVLTLRGTPVSQTWQEQAGHALASQYFGLAVTQSFGLRDLVAELERTGRFLFARDPLQVWDFATASWIGLTDADLDRSFAPGAAFQTRAVTGSSASAGSASTRSTSVMVRR